MSGIPVLELEANRGAFEVSGNKYIIAVPAKTTAVQKFLLKKELKESFPAIKFAVVPIEALRIFKQSEKRGRTKKQQEDASVGE